MDNYVIKRDDQLGRMLMGLSMENANPYTTYKTEWTEDQRHALHLTREEAQATIEFIINVIDEALGEQLYCKELES